MRLPIARLLVKAAKWLAPRVQEEIAAEVQRRNTLYGSRQAGVPQEPINDSYARPRGSPPSEPPPG